MKMSVLCFSVGFCVTAGVFAQQKKQVVENDSVVSAVELPVVTHKVEMGETILLIARKYHITPRDIYELNPDATKGVTYNTILQLPADKVKMPSAKKKQSAAGTYVAVRKGTGF